MLNSATSSIAQIRASIAANRFGYGASEGELKSAAINPKQWVISQLKPITFDTFMPNSHDVFDDHAYFLKVKKAQKKKDKSIDKEIQGKARNVLHQLSADTIMRAIQSDHSVSWRLLDFFSNHFSVSAKGRLMVGLAATLEREAIAPYLFGNFEYMLLAVEQHPAMLIYLNNEKSFGPNSRISRKRNVGLNENLAREILELHTLGVKGNYNQSDVLALAKGITGWSVKNLKTEASTGYVYRENAHEPGAQTLLETIYNQKGEDQGKQMLKDLAVHPSTAKYLCYKLAHHFVSEEPVKSLTDKMELTWLKTNGNIKAVMTTLFEAEESWVETYQKFKTPRDFIISTMRAVSPEKIKDKFLLNALNSLGQPPFNAGSPAGYSDKVGDWLGASALMARVDWASMISGYRKNINVEKIIAISLGESISDHSYQMVMRAESRQLSSILWLMSPEFQRR